LIYNSINIKNIGVWTLFSIAILRGLELLDLSFYLYYFLFPGILFFCFLFYYLLKTNVFINSRLFILSITTISIIYHFIFLVFIRFIRLQFRSGDLLRFLAMFIVSILVSAILYYSFYLLKGIIKK
jgi:hypothetical protein